MRFIQREQSPAAGRPVTGTITITAAMSPAHAASSAVARSGSPTWPGWWWRSARTRPQGAPRGHPHGCAAAARGGAAQRLPDHAGGPGAQRRHLEPEPRLGLPGAGAARGRGPDPHPGEDGRKLFAITDEGRAVVAERGAERPAPWEQAGDGAGGAHELGRLMREVASAFMQVMRTGSEGQIAKAAGVLADTRRDLYRILADGDVQARRRRAAWPGRRRRCRYGGPRQVSETATTELSPASARASSPAVSVNGLVKRYDELEAVRGIDFEVAAGEIFGFLGPNGAGKSTTINMLCTLVRPSGGSCAGGRPRRRLRTRRRPAQHRAGLPGHDARRLPHRRAEPAPARRALRCAPRSRRRAHAPGDGDGRAVGAARQPREHVLRRHEAAPGDRPRPACTRRVSCSWTSRPWASTRRPAARSGATSAS